MVLFYPTCIYKDPPLVPSSYLASNTAPSSRRLVPVVSTGCPPRVVHTSPNCFRPCNCCQREMRALLSREALTPATAAVVFVPLSLIFLLRFCLACECCSAATLLKVGRRRKEKKNHKKCTCTAGRVISYHNNKCCGTLRRSLPICSSASAHCVWSNLQV